MTGSQFSQEITQVSIVMTVFNTEQKLVQRAIDSVLQQEMQSFELIIVNDGSNKSISDFVQSIALKHPEKIKYIYHNNLGQSESINQGLKLCSSKYVTFIDSDDEYKKDHLKKCLLEIGDLDLISSFTETVVNSELDYYVPDKNNPLTNIHVDECIMLATLFGKKNVFEAVPFKNKYAADAQFYEEISKKFKVRKANIRTYIYYRNNSDSISAKLKNKQI